MKSLDHLEGVLSGYINLGKGLMSLLKLETKLAGLSVFPLLINLCLLLMILITLWISLMVIVAYYVAITLGSLLGGMGIVSLLNMSLLFIVLHSLKRGLRRMSFEKSRALLSQTGNKDHDFTH